MTADKATSYSPAVLNPTDVAITQASSLVAARTLQERLLDPERITSVGREHPCPTCGSRNVAQIAYGRIILDRRDARIAAGEMILGGCLVQRERFNCNACGHRFLEQAVLQPTGGAHGGSRSSDGEA